MVLGEFGLKEIIFLFVVLILTVPLYFLPTIIAIAKKRENRLAIVLINFFLGWSFIGWVGALVWACIADKPKMRDLEELGRR